MADEAPTRNLVLSACDLKPNGEPPTGRVCAQTAMCGPYSLYLYGGADERQAYSEVHVMSIDKALWKETKVGGFTKPAARYGHSMKAWGDELVVFGGLAAGEQISDTGKYQPPPFMGAEGKPWNHRGTPVNDVFKLNTSTMIWSQPDVTGVTPSPRAFHACALIAPEGGEQWMMVLGGATDSSLGADSADNELFVLDLPTMKWFKVTQVGTAPTPRYGHQMCYVPGRNYVLMFGGADDDGAMFCLKWRPNTKTEMTWTRVDVASTAPFSRSFHSMDAVGGNRVFVFAGQTTTGVSDLYVYDIAKSRWNRPLYEGQVNIRAHASTVLHDKLIVFGGARERATGESAKRGGTLGETDESISSQVATSLTGGGLGESFRISKKLFFISVLELKEGSGDGEFKFKVVTIGDSGVGKTSLLTRFVQDCYSDFHVSTVGVDYRSVVAMVKGKLVTLQLWDTAGQERFSGVTGNYYRASDGFVVVFDATRRETFDHIESWLTNIQKHHEFGPNTMKLLIGNKYDLKTEVQVDEEEGAQLANRLKMTFVPTSAKTAANVDAAFLSSASLLVDIRKANASKSKAMSLSGGPASGLVLTDGDSGGGQSGQEPQPYMSCGGCSVGPRGGPNPSPSQVSNGGSTERSELASGGTKDGGMSRSASTTGS
eukprot:GHVN01019474.1.p1 GENE.GHVN01019474.1~~GHVN01019474.1.p1  ORF type:complete len:656 (-),score=90.79 GHVN01019474.1:3122-5089(-)